MNTAYRGYEHAGVMLEIGQGDAAGKAHVVLGGTRVADLVDSAWVACDGAWLAEDVRRIALMLAENACYHGEATRLLTASKEAYLAIRELGANA